MKKLIIAGGTGFLGQALIAHFNTDFDSIVVLSRTAHKSSGNTRYLAWDAKTTGSWCAELEGADALINLCGKSVDCRYTDKNKAEIFASRLDSTKVIGEAILNCNQPPALWINGASATIYRHSEQTPMTELTGEIGSGFSVEVCKAWEKTFNVFRLPATRMVNLRLSMVLGTTGGVIPTMVSLVKKGLGGTLGNGKQLMSWLHVEDFCRMIGWLLTHSSAHGTYNAVAPAPVSNKALMKLLREKTGMRIGLPAPRLILEIGALLIRTETELILKSRYAVPERFVKEGFVFKHTTIEGCLDSFSLG